MTTSNDAKLTKTAKTAGTKKAKLTEIVGARIESLDARIVRIAKKFCKFEPGSEYMEYYQAMLTGLLERQTVDPTFFKQTDAFILKYAEFVGRHKATKARIYTKYVDEEGDQIEPEEMEEDADTALTLMATRTKIQQSIENVEYGTMNSELADAIIEGCKILSPESLKVVYLLYLGYKQSEIAEIMHVSKPAVSQRIKTIASYLEGFVQGY